MTKEKVCSRQKEQVSMLLERNSNNTRDRKSRLRSICKKGVISLFAGILLMTMTVMPSVEAAGFELSITGKKMLAQTKTSSATSIAQALAKQEANLVSLQQKDTTLSQQTSAIYYENKEAEARLRTQLKQHQADKIATLNQDVTSTKKRYEPLFTLYSSLTKELALARKIKNKELTAAVKAQVDTTKVAVTLAKEDIRRKQAKLSAAKKTRDEAVKKVKNSLAQQDPVKVQIKSTKSNMSAAKKRFTAEMKNFNVIVKKKEGAEVLASLTKLATIAGEIVAQKESIISLEMKVKQIIAGAGKQLI
ncbi:hypothetical protein QPK24_04400 [Paenibacillus polygoni]|uniref:Colicin import membrane protein n=1 Tax=Paenibacillus polygoni TaxID=3050112 RepID=A0ABY8X5K4_9BACL|nr:hypothetical protein [Paenibacillus polygoni]WIV19964.1 hypothetical protein QPK24_04400 [Paenibacillus polygoni]